MSEREKWGGGRDAQHSASAGHGIVLMKADANEAARSMRAIMCNKWLPCDQS